MNVLAVSAYPEPRSFTAAVASRAIRFFGNRGDRVEESDLYAMEFNPVAHARDFNSRRDPDYLTYALEQRHGWRNGTIAADIRAELEKVLAAELLLFVFPLYWFSVPAIMKGWFDRVLLSGVTYGGRAFYDRGRLRGRRAMLLVTMGSRRNMFGSAAVHGSQECMLAHLQRGTLQYVGLDVMPPFIAYHVPYISSPQRREQLAKLEHHLEGLQRMKPLPSRRLGDFDEDMQPVSTS